jgi:hypothetical protein
LARAHVAGGPYEVGMVKTNEFHCGRDGRPAFVCQTSDVAGVPSGGSQAHSASAVISGTDTHNSCKWFPHRSARAGAGA